MKWIKIESSNIKLMKNYRNHKHVVVMLCEFFIYLV